ncbi:MAG: hypothetical protein ACREBN_10490, partial [Burkholderiaceae bacterium]
PSAAVIVLSSAVLTAFALNTLKEQPRAASRFSGTHPGAWLVPRFWEQGLLYESPPGHIQR